MKIAFIIRGVPGSGKSTVAKHLAGGLGRIVSADHYFEKDGQYRFVREDLGKAHFQCRVAFTEAVADEVPVIVVDNTNIKKRDYEYYEDFGSRHGYTVVTVVMENMDPVICHARNTHAVPLETIQRMTANFER
jgi:predicted kinase